MNGTAGDVIEMKCRAAVPILVMVTALSIVVPVGNVPKLVKVVLLCSIGVPTENDTMSWIAVNVNCPLLSWIIYAVPAASQPRLRSGLVAAASNW